MRAREHARRRRHAGRCPWSRCSAWPGRGPPPGPGAPRRAPAGASQASRRCLHTHYPSVSDMCVGLDGCQPAHGGLALTAMAARVCVVGSVNADLTFTVDALPRPGQTVLASSLLVCPGWQGRQPGGGRGAGRRLRSACRRTRHRRGGRAAARPPARQRGRARRRGQPAGAERLGGDHRRRRGGERNRRRAGRKRASERGLRRRPGGDRRQRRGADAVGDPDRHRHRGRSGRAGRGRGRHRQRVTGRRQAP